MTDHSKDISIGKNEWIEWVDFNPSNDTLRIDDLLEPAWPFLNKFETECVVECCGIDAFCFWPEDIKKASEGFDASALKTMLVSIQERIRENTHEVVIAGQFNNLFHKSVFDLLLAHLIRNL